MSNRLKLKTLTSTLPTASETDWTEVSRTMQAIDRLPEIAATCPACAQYADQMATWAATASEDSREWTHIPEIPNCLTTH
jgi:hypothetical protein